MSRDVETRLNEILQGLAAPEAAVGTSKRVELLEEALALLPREAAERHWAYFQAELGRALVRSPTSDPETCLERAIDAYHAALEVRTREAAPEEWAATMLNLANAYQRASTRENLGRALESYRRVLEVFTLEEAPERWAVTRINQAYLFSTLADTPRAEEYEEAIRALEDGLRHLPPDSDPYSWASAAMDLGTLLAKRVEGAYAENLERALTAYRDAIRVFDRSRIPTERARTQTYLAAVLVERQHGNRADNLEEAVAACRKALEVLEPARDSERTATWLHLGHALRHRVEGERSPNQEQAIAAYERALESAAEDGRDPSLVASIRMGLGNVYQERLAGDPRENIDRAFACYREARRVLDRDRNLLDWAGLSINLANAHLETFTGPREENLERAEELCWDALEILRRDEHPRDWLAAVTTLANTLRQRSQPEPTPHLLRAKELYEQALEVRTRESAPFGWARTVVNLGIVYRDLLLGDRAANLEKALELFKQALEVQTPESTPLDWAATMMHLGSAYQERLLGFREENLEKAVLACQAAIEIQRHHGEIHHQGIAHMFLGNALLHRPRGDKEENLERAIHHYEEALRYFTDRGRVVDRGITQLNLASAYAGRKQGNPRENVERGLEACRDALAIFPREASAYHWAAIRQNEAMLFARLGGAAKKRAVDAFQQALEIFHPESFPADRLMTAHNLGDLHFDAGEWAEAVEAYQVAIQAAEYLYRASTLPTSREAELAERLDLHHKLAFALARLGRLEQAAMALESVRGRALREALEGQEETAGVDSRAELAELTQAAQGGQPLVYLTATPAGTLALLLSARASAEIEVEPLWCLALTDEDLDSLLMQWDQDRLVGGFVHALVGDPAAFAAILPRILADLGEKLARPLAEKLRARGERSAVLIATGRLGLLPLHAAPYSTPTGPRSLIDEFDLSQAPSARLLAAARRKLETLRAPRRLAGVSNPLPHGRPLEHARLELAAVAELFADGERTVLEGEDATRGALSPLLADAGYLHFSCHGVLDTWEPRRSHLELAAGDRLSLSEILESEVLPVARLVVLSACQTAVSEFQNLPDETLGFPAGFLAAGAAGVLASLWKVEELSTALLVRAFYRYHLVGDPSGGEAPLPPPAALRRAQLWLRDVRAAELAAFFDGKGELLGGVLPLGQEPALVELAWRTATRFLLEDPDGRPFAEPYYWAGFVFSGA